MIDCYMSLPAIISPAGDEHKLLEALSSKQSFFKTKEFCNQTFLVGEVENIPLLSDFPLSLRSFYTRTNALLLACMLKLSSTIQALKTKIKKDRIGICIGTTTSGVQENFEIFLHSSNFALDYQNHLNALCAPADFARAFFGVEGPSFGISTACTSGLKSLIQAYRLIECDLCDAVIVGATDSLSAISLFGFRSLDILSNKPCNPFSLHRDGITIGEGACLLIMSKMPLDSSVVLERFCSNNDAFHLTKQDQQAKQAIKAIKSVIANLKIDYINLHATGTQANEITESFVIASLLPNTYASGIKGHIGHTLGATGAIEAGVCCMLLNQEMSLLPIHLYDGYYDSTLPLIRLVEKETFIQAKRILSVNFAFGGDNVAAVFRRKS